MGMVYAAKKGEKPASPAVAKAAKGMSTKSAKDFASTKHKGLPEKKKKKVKEAIETITALTEMLSEAKGKIKGVDGKACWKGKRYAGKVKKADGTYKDKCIPVGEGIADDAFADLDAEIERSRNPQSNRSSSAPLRSDPNSINKFDRELLKPVDNDPPGATYMVNGVKMNRDQYKKFQQDYGNKQQDPREMDLDNQMQQFKLRNKVKEGGKEGDKYIIKSGPNKGKRWSPDTPGPTNPNYKEIDGNIPSPPDGATAPPPGWKPEKSKSAPAPRSNKRADAGETDDVAMAETTLPTKNPPNKYPVSGGPVGSGMRKAGELVDKGIQKATDKVKDIISPKSDEKPKIDKEIDEGKKRKKDLTGDGKNNFDDVQAARRIASGQDKKTAVKAAKSDNLKEGDVSTGNLQKMLQYTSMIGNYVEDEEAKQYVDELKSMLKWYLEQDAKSNVQESKKKKSLNEWSIEFDPPPKTGSHEYQLYGKDRQRYDALPKNSGPESERVRQYYKDKKLDKAGETQKWSDERDADYADRLNAVRAARIANNELTPGEWIRKGANAVRTALGGEDRPLKPARTVVDLDGPGYPERFARYVGDEPGKKFLDPKADAAYKERQRALFPDKFKEGWDRDELAARLFETSDDHYDHEATMAKAQLMRIAEQSIELFKMIQEGDNLEGWVAAKITKANDYINAVHQNMAYDEVADQEKTISSDDDYMAELRSILERKIKS